MTLGWALPRGDVVGICGEDDLIHGQAIFTHPHAQGMQTQARDLQCRDPSAIHHIPVPRVVVVKAIDPVGRGVFLAIQCCMAGVRVAIHASRQDPEIVRPCLYKIDLKVQPRARAREIGAL